MGIGVAIALAIGPGGRTFEETTGKSYVSHEERAWYLTEVVERGSTIGPIAQGWLNAYNNTGTSAQAQTPKPAPQPAQQAPDNVTLSASPQANVSSGTNGHLHSIKECESGGDYTAVNLAGYYGAYQFDFQTWASVGGTGNPANASPAEQDMRAQMLYNQRGSQPWPICQHR